MKKGVYDVFNLLYVPYKIKMFNIDDENVKKMYKDLMENIKNVNLDWINLYYSKEYKLGKSFIELKNSIKKFRIPEAYKSLTRKINGKKAKKVKTITTITNNKETIPNYFLNKRIAIYTSVFGGYDRLLEPKIIPNNCDFYAITDIEINKDSAWKKIDCPNEMENMTNIEKNRYVKIKPHLIFKNYDYSIYVDGNIQIITDLTEYIHLLNDVHIATHRHHLRDCVYDELDAIEKSKKDSKSNVMKHKNFLLEADMPKNYGLLQCSVIVREHNHSQCIKIMDEWWEEFKNYSKRDQVSLPHILFKNNIPVNKVGVLGNNIYKNASFRIYNHN